MKENDISWVAGLIEGEGSFIVRKYGIVMQCQMTDLDVLQRLQSICGGSISNMFKRESHHKDSWLWQLSANKAYNLAKLIFPLMLNRRQGQAKTMMDSWESSLQKRNIIKNERNNRNEKIYKLRNNGLTYREISKIVGLERSTVSRILENSS